MHVTAQLDSGTWARFHAPPEKLIREGGPLVVGKIDSEEALERLEADWLDLERSSGNAIPFRTYTWVATWWKWMRQSSRAIKDSLAIRTVRTSEGRLVAVAPLMLTERPSVGPLRVRCLEFIGPDPNMTEVRGTLCEPDLGSACYAAIRDDLARSEDGVDWVRWTGIDERHGARTVFDSGSVDCRDDIVCSVLPLPETWEELHSTRPRNLKESLRKCYNAPKRDGLGVTCRVVRARDEVGPALEDFFRLHAERAHLEGTISHGDVFDHPARRAFLVDACERFAERGELRIFRLYVGDTLAATRIGFVLSDCLYLYYSGFDVAYAKYSVMTTCVAEAIKVAIGEKLAWVNLSTGRDVSKLRWRPQELAFHEALVVSDGAVGRAKYELFDVARRAVRRPALQPLARLLRARQRDSSVSIH